jgi:hypothetical protein
MDVYPIDEDPDVRPMSTAISASENMASLDADCGGIESVEEGSTVSSLDRGCIDDTPCLDRGGNGVGMEIPAVVAGARDRDTDDVTAEDEVDEVVNQYAITDGARGDMERRRCGSERLRCNLR